MSCGASLERLVGAQPLPSLTLPSVHSFILFFACVLINVSSLISIFCLFLVKFGETPNQRDFGGFHDVTSCMFLLRRISFFARVLVPRGGMWRRG